MPDEPTLGQIAYDAYGDDRGWKTANGGDMPRWADQRAELQHAWERAANAAADRVARAHVAPCEPAEAFPWRELDSEAAHGGRDYATVRIRAEEELGPGGAPHVYALCWDERMPQTDGSIETRQREVRLRFQNGPIQEVGINGITAEALIAIVADRLKHFQRGPYPSVHNESALWHLQAALDWLHSRTRDRARRGVEGRTAL